MTARIIDGKEAAAALRAKVQRRVAALVSRGAPAPGLAVVLVGENPASLVYIRNKARQTVAAGMHSFEHHLPEGTQSRALLDLIARLNADDSVDGILVQLPLPGKLDAAAIVETIDPAKDVDGLHPVNIGRLASGQAGLVPCTPLGCDMLLADHVPRFAGLNAVVVGRSSLVGRPMANLLLRRDCTVTIAHSKTRDLPGLCRTADILVAAIGRAETIRGDWIKPGATVIDVGINRRPGPEGGKDRLVGDVAFAEAVKVAGAITPVPGGVGPMTIACLLANTVTAACRRRGLEVPAV